jgi:hypothetical protein
VLEYTNAKNWKQQNVELLEFFVGMKPVCGHPHLKVDYWQPQHAGEILNRVAFVPLLKEVTESSAEPETHANTFLACGLYPLTLKCFGLQ